ncbi:MAG: hypothetical protein HY909_05295 [Deltaproteobacteria bacterium]|nr:hypothetical protein [Deltaproteobacteria bacterium]
MDLPPYHTIEGLIELIDEPNRAACKGFLATNLALMERTQGSTNNHQAWPGGYKDHVQEIMNIARVLYRTYEALRPLPFSLSDALLVVFLHDVEKLWKYVEGDDGALHRVPSMQTKEGEHAFRAEKFREYGFVLSEEQRNGLKYAEGELRDYSNRERRMGPLAALCHCADVTSARLWFDHPLATAADPWEGARRVRRAT